MVGRAGAWVCDNMPCETWTFTMEDGSVIEKNVCVRTDTLEIGDEVSY